MRIVPKELWREINRLFVIVGQNKIQIDHSNSGYFSELSKKY